MAHARSSSTSASAYASAEISYVQRTSHISFWISFKFRKCLTAAEIWPPYFCRPRNIIKRVIAIFIKNFDL